MMTLVRLTVVTALVFVLGGTAHAGVFGWIEKLSGPGPFLVTGEAIPLWCRGIKDKDLRQTEADLANGLFRSQNQGLGAKEVIHDAALKVAKPTWFTTYNCRSAAQDAPYLVAGGDVLVMWTHDNPFTSESNSTIIGFSLIPYLDVHVNRYVDIGTGFGATRFSGTGFDSFWKPTYQPLRVTFRPLVPLGRKKIFEALLFRVTATSYGKMRGSDFGTNPNGISYKQDGEFVWGTVVMLDLSRLIRYQKHTD